MVDVEDGSIFSPLSFEDMKFFLNGHILCEIVIVVRDIIFPKINKKY